MREPEFAVSASIDNCTSICPGSASKFQPKDNVEMDQSEFDDLFETSHVKFSTSQHSLTASAAQLAFCESDEEVSPVLVTDDAIPNEEYEKQQASESLGLYDDNRNDQHLCNSMNNVAPSGLRSSAPQALPHTPEASCQGQGHIAVLQRIERIFQKICNSLLHESDDVGLTLKVRTSTDDISRNAKRRRLNFPGRTAEEAWRFGETSTSARSRCTNIIQLSLCGCLNSFMKLCEQVSQSRRGTSLARHSRYNRTGHADLTRKRYLLP